MASLAHPFDADYEEACQLAGAEPEEQSLWGLYRFLDTSGAERMSRGILEASLPILRGLASDDLQMSDDLWARIDRDGNGYVSFPEFATWAEPRFKLELGVKHMFSPRSREEEELPATQGVQACGIVGCSCTGFRPMSRSDRRAARGPRYPEHEWGHEGAGLCACGHKHGAHAHKTEGEVPYPSHWKCAGLFEFNDLEPVGSALLPFFQQLVDDTHLGIWTRDRKRHHDGRSTSKVPKQYRVVNVMRNENSKAWRAYAIRRARLMGRCSNVPPTTYADVKSTVSWQSHQGVGGDGLAPSCNEWYAFHGTHDAAARAICRSNFKMSLAGTHTGTLYGRGTYLSEAVTKADEYATPNENGEYAVLVCRALGGNVRYTDEEEPSADELASSCTEGPFDCVLGDRQKCRGTYREFVFFDSENIYPEYLVLYKRVY